MEELEARAIIARFIGRPGDLAAHLISISGTKPGVIHWVFNLLDHPAAYRVAYRYLKPFTLWDPTPVYLLIRTKEGLISAKTLLWVVENIPSPDPAFNSFDASEKYVLANLIKNAKAPDNASQPRQLSTAEMNWYANYNQGPEATYEWVKAKGKYVLGAGPRTTFNQNICWQLPASGVGYVVYNVNDLSKHGFLKDKSGYDQIGTKETIYAMIEIAGKWNAIHPDKLLQYGDISRPGGVNTPDHATHNDGKAFDMRPLRNDGMTGDAAKVPSPSDRFYHRDHTKEFILLARRLYPGTTFYYNDKVIYEDRQFSSFVSYKDGHNDHLHVMFSF